MHSVNPVSTKRPVLAAAILSLTLAGGFIAGEAFASQTRMSAALDALRVARRELAAATSDKGGHRKQALSFVDKAIAQVQKGMAYDKRH